MIRRTAVLLALFATAAVALPAGASASPERYIVVLNSGASDPGAVAGEHSRRYNASVSAVWSQALKGYAATIPSERLAEVRADERVAYVEPDGTMTATAQTLPWGIDRIDADISSTVAGNGAGVVAGVTAYVIDTGIASHRDLNVTGHVNFANGRNTDCNGHGTHVAGTVAAKDDTNDVVGAAPGAPLVGVKVLGCGGSGTTSGVISGVDWVTADAAGKPAIANMSLGGGASTALDEAVRRSAASGVVYSLAAGNDGANACNSSPARAGAGTDNGIITTAATNPSNAETSWSNFGPCVDIWAPGASILSTRKGGGTTTMSGTSMAAPHVGGGAALYLSSHAGAGPATVEGALKGTAVATGTSSKDGLGIKLLNVAGF